MPGWRMAMLASNAQFVQWILKVKSNIDSGQFKPMQYAAVEALSAKKEWYDNMNRVYRSRRNLAGQIMRTLGCEYDENQVRYVPLGTYPRLRPRAARQSPTRCYTRQTYSLRRDLIFGSRGERYIRISLCCKNEYFRRSLEKIE